MTQTILAADGRFGYLGRWLDPRQSGWQGAQIRFKLSGPTTLKVTCDIVDPGVDNQAFLIINDNKGNWDDHGVAVLTTLAESFTGEKSHTFTISGDGEHTIILRPFMWPVPQWDATTDKNSFKSIEISDDVVMSVWEQGVTITGCVGDSWMGTQNDWPYLLSDRYSLWPLSFGGAKASDLDAKIDFMYSGVAVSGDPVMDIVLVNSAVNDYNAAVTTAAYEISLNSLIDKIRAQQPTATIFIIDSPDNTGAGKTFSQYGPNMSTVAASKANCYYIPLTGIDTLTWLDGAHIDFASRQVLADFVDAAVISQLGYQVQAGSSKPWITENRLSGTRIATEYDGLTPYTFNKPGSEPVGIATPGTSALYVG